MREGDKLDLIIDMMKEQIDDNKKVAAKLDARITKTEEQLYLYKTIIKVAKAIGVTILLVITFRFGDILKLMGK